MIKALFAKILHDLGRSRKRKLETRYLIAPMLKKGKGGSHHRGCTTVEEEGGSIASNVEEEMLGEEGGVHRVGAASEDIVVEDPFFGKEGSEGVIADKGGAKPGVRNLEVEGLHDGTEVGPSDSEPTQHRRLTPRWALAWISLLLDVPVLSKKFVSGGGD